MRLPLGHNQAIECTTSYCFKPFPLSQQHDCLAEHLPESVSALIIHETLSTCVFNVDSIFFFFFASGKKNQISRIILLFLAFVDSLTSKVKLHNYLSSWSANYCCVFTRRHFIGINWVSEICLDMPSRSSQSHEGVYSLWNCLFQLPGNMRLFDF